MHLLQSQITKANECAKFIIQAGIQEIIYVKDDDPDSDSSRASRILFEVAGVKMQKIEPSTTSIKINFGTSAASSTDGDRGDRKTDDSSNNSNAKQNEDEMEKYLGLLQREANIDPFQFKVKKRSDYLSWDEYFMGIAFLSAQRSKDPNTQVGACIIDANKCIIGIGYNGFPRGCSDSVLPWARSAECDLHKKYPYGKRHLNEALGRFILLLSSTVHFSSSHTILLFCVMSLHAFSCTCRSKCHS